MILEDSAMIIRRTGVKLRALIAERMFNSYSGVQGALSELRDLAITPDQTEAYAKAVRIYNPTYAYEHPAFVAFPNNVDDVRRCLQVAHATGPA